MPKRAHVAINGGSPKVGSLLTVDHDSPAGLGDGSGNDGHGRLGRRNPSERNAIIGCRAFG